jgi:hypothetical protein
MLAPPSILRRYLSQFCQLIIYILPIRRPRQINPAVVVAQVAGDGGLYDGWTPTWNMPSLRTGILLQGFPYGPCLTIRPPHHISWSFIQRWGAWKQPLHLKIQLERRRPFIAPDSRKLIRKRRPHRTKLDRPGQHSRTDGFGNPVKRILPGGFREDVPTAVELRWRSSGDQAASSLVGVTARVASRASRRAGRYR